MFKTSGCATLSIQQTVEQGGHMETFFTDDDLFDLLEELDQENSEIEILETEAEMQASNRRFEEIILKHRVE